MLLRNALRTSPRAKAIFGSVHLDRKHPLVRNLEFFTAFLPFGATGGTDNVRGSFGASTTGIMRSPRGIQTAGSSTDSWLSAAVGGDGPYTASTGLTLAWRGVMNTTPNYHCFITKAADNAFLNCPFFWISNNNVTQMFVARGTASVNNAFTSTSGVGTGVGLVVDMVTTFADNLIQTVPLGYINAKPVTYTGGANTGTVTGSGAALNLGRPPDASANLVGEVVHVAIWSRPLSAAEVAEFYAEPYAMLRPVVRRRVISIVATVPGAPTGATATAGNTTADVTFTPPASDGGSTITGYTVTSSPAGGTDTDAGTLLTTHHITGLTNGVAYTFTVTATNAVGTSAPSAPSNSVTPSAGAGTLEQQQRRRWLFHRSSTAA